MANTIRIDGDEWFLLGKIKKHTRIARLLHGGLQVRTAVLNNDGWYFRDPIADHFSPAESQVLQEVLVLEDILAPRKCTQCGDRVVRDRVNALCSGDCEFSYAQTLI